MGPSGSSRRVRIVIGTVLLLLVVGLFALDRALECRWAVGSLIALSGLAGFLEYARLTALWRRSEGGSPFLGAWGLAAVGYFFLAAAWAGGERTAGPQYELGGLAVFLAGGFLSTFGRRDFDKVLNALAAALLGVVLFGWLYPYLLRVYLSGSADDAVIRGGALFLGVKGTDIAAYLVGSALGRHHFLPVSPGKTVEGSLAALLFGAAWFGAASLTFPEQFFGWWEGILFGIILAVASALGDLTESLIKRSCRVKDSGALLPEFGGVLDLIDSFVYTAFIFWCLL